MDISLEAAERARLLLQELTLEEKLAQLTCYFPQGTDYSALKNNYPHGVGQVSALEMRTLDTLEEGSGNGDGAKPSPYSGYFPYGRVMRGVYPGCAQPSGRD